MKHIKTTATTIKKIKSTAKNMQAEQNIPHSTALELAAKHHGYENYHHAISCAAKTEEQKTSSVIGKLYLRPFDQDGSVCFDVKDDRKLDAVTEQLDELIEQVDGGFGDMSTYSDYALQIIAAKCQALTAIEPAFLDGYAHQVGALTELGHTDKAIAAGKPAFDAALELIKAAPKKSYPNYYISNNRPFYRLAKNLVLALHKEKQSDQAREIALLMLKLNPNDNSGFRFLLEPLED